MRALIAQPPAGVVGEMQVVDLQPVQRRLLGREPERPREADAEKDFRPVLQTFRHALGHVRVGRHVVGTVQANVGHADLKGVWARRELQP